MTAIVDFAFMAVSGIAFAAGASVLKVSKSIAINASDAKVWEQAKNFSGLNTWHPAVESDKIVEGSDNKVGACASADAQGRRHDQGKAAGVQQCPAHVPSQHPRGRIAGQQLHVDVRRRADGQEQREGHLVRRVPAQGHRPKPADNANDKTATDTMAGVYQSGLDNLKKIVEGK
jgi:mxaD protein